MNDLQVAPLVAAYMEQISKSLVPSTQILPRFTDEELAERRARRDAAVSRVTAALAEVEDPAIRAVVDLHRQADLHDECAGCDPGSYAESGAWWPCSTIYAIAPFVGIEESDLNQIR